MVEEKLPGEVKPYRGELLRVETTWGVHTVTPGFGKHEGKFVAQSRGWGGAQGYFKVCPTEQEAREYVARQTKPLDPDEAIKL